MLDAIVALSLISNPPWKTLNGPRRRQTNTNTLTETETSMNKQTGERENKKISNKSGSVTAKPEPRYKNQGADRWSPIRKTNEPAPDLGFICIYRAATAIRKFIGYPYTEPFRLINSTRKLIYTSYRDNPQEIRSIYLVIVSWSTIKKSLIYTTCVTLWLESPVQQQQGH